MGFHSIITGSIYFCYVIITCSSEHILAPKNVTPYEYIVEHTPRHLKIMSDKLFKNGIPDELIDLYAPVKAKNELCRNESIIYRNSLKNFEAWAFKMWDSSGKIPPGILDAHFYDLGNFDECLAVPEIGPFDVKYCLIEVKSFLPPAVNHVEMMESRSMLLGSLSFMKDHLYLARCVPASCDKEDLEDYYTNTVSEYNMTVVINKNGCTASNEKEPYNAWDWGTVIYLTCTTVLLVTSTIYNKFLSKDDKKGFFANFILCFSLSTNVNQILTKKHLKTKLSHLNGLKGTAMILILWVHMCVCAISIPKVNYLQLIKDFLKPTYGMAIVATFNQAVEVFFVISGLLISYTQINNKKLGRKFKIKVYYIKRFIRIIPPYAIQIAILITMIYRYLGSGPLWKINIGTSRDNCLKNWWLNLLFINNYVNQDEMCIGTNWYLAADMQLYLIAPLIVIPMIKWKVFRKCVIPLLIIASDLWTFFDSYMNEYRAGAMVDLQNRTEKNNQHIYIATHSRFSSWLLGVYLGYILQKLEDNPKEKILSRMTVWIGWCLTALVQLLAILSLYLYMSEHEPNNLIDSLYNGFHRTIFSASVCWIIYACELGYGGFIYNFLTWYPMQVVGRLSFAAYLSQMIIITGIDSMTMISQQYQTFIILRIYIANLFLVYIQSFFLSVMFECPSANLGKLLSAEANKVNPTTEEGNLPEKNSKEQNEEGI